MSDHPQRSRSIGAFLWRNKIWWLMPAVGVLLLIALLLYFGPSSSTSPFVYTLF